MKRYGVLLFLTLIVIASCTDHKAIKLQQEHQVIDLSYSPVPVERLQVGKPKEGWIIGKSVQYSPMHGQKTAMLHLYVDPSGENPANNGEINAFLEDNHVLYEIGVVSFYGLADVHVEMTDRASPELDQLQITGGLGASYGELKLIGFDKNSGEWVNYLTMGTPEFMDLDGDGNEELIAVSAGSIPSYVDMYRWNNGRFEKAEIAQQTDSEYALLNRKRIDNEEMWIIETGTSQGDKGAKSYQYDGGKLIEVMNPEQQK